LCARWRIVKRSAIDALPDDVAWVCGMNSDVRHNSCSAPQRLWMTSAPEDGERVEPRGLTSRATLQSHRLKIGEAEASGLQRRLPASMQDAGWLLLPSGGTWASHRLEYAYIGPCSGAHIGGGGPDASCEAASLHFARRHAAGAGTSAAAPLPAVFEVR